MLDLLSEEKKKILLNYPFVRRFLKGELKGHVFLKNLESFRKEIMAQGFKKEELDSITDMLGKKIVILIGSHSNETTAEIIGRQAYKNLKKQGYPMTLMRDDRKTNLMDSRIKRAYKRMGKLKVTKDIIPNDKYIREVDFRPWPYEIILPKKHPEKFFISFHNHEPEMFLRGNIQAYNPKVRIEEIPKPLREDYYSYWDNDIVLSKYLENLWIIEIPAFWEHRQKSPLLKFLDASKETIQEYKRHNFYGRIGIINIKKSKQLGLCGKEIIEKSTDGIKELIKRYLIK